MMLRFISEPLERRHYAENNNSTSTPTPTLNKSNCSTLPNLNHSSGWSTKISLNLHDHNEPWRSGEEISGTIDLSENNSENNELAVISSLLVRCYWQSTTLVSTHVIVPPKNKGTKGLTVVQEKIRKAEFHGGYTTNGGEGIELWEEAGHLETIRREIEGDFPLLGDRIASTLTVPLPSIETSIPIESDEISRRSFPFKFLLPTSTRSQFANPSTFPPANRGELMNSIRTPPPTYSSSGEPYSNGAVEWVVEALLIFVDPSLPEVTPLSPSNELPPSFTTSLHHQSIEALDSHGLVKSTPHLLANRITFNFEPLDADQLSWYHEVKRPSIGRDPREELGGTPKVLETREDLLSNELLLKEGGKDKWSTYEKDYIVKSTLGRDVGIFRSEISCPVALSTSRHSPSIPIHLAFSYTPLPAKSFLPTNSKPLDLSKLSITLFERILTRSGSAIRSSMTLNELRKEVHILGRTSVVQKSDDGNNVFLISNTKMVESSEKYLKLLPSIPSPNQPLITSLSLSLNLQSPPSIPLRSKGISFRVPNLEREYFISISVELGDRDKTGVVIARIPLMVLAGDEDDLPPWIEEQNEVVMEMERDLIGEGETTVRVVDEVEGGLPDYC